jgi:hypothetical protein
MTQTAVAVVIGVGLEQVAHRPLLRHLFKVVERSDVVKGVD